MGNGKVTVMQGVLPKSARAFRNFAGFVLLAALAFGAVSAHAAEYITLTNGFNLICDHRAPDGNKVRLYMDSGSTNFIEVDPAQIASSEFVNLPAAPDANPAANRTQQTSDEKLSDAELHQLLARAGAEHDLDTDLLASVAREESAGHTRAVSHAGAEGLMQLMPTTAADLGVANTFAPADNIKGGTAYLDTLLHRYHDNLALALAAYNAGPAAVDRFHGIPPYRETQLYVARVIHEFNRRIAARKAHALTQVATAVR